MIFRSGSNKSANLAGHLHLPNSVTNSVRCLTMLHWLEPLVPKTRENRKYSVKPTLGRTCPLQTLQRMKSGSACSANRNMAYNVRVPSYVV
jgi:hypothetical protein